MRWIMPLVLLAGMLCADEGATEKCMFEEGDYLIDVFFGQKAGFEEGWKEYDGVNVLRKSGFEALECKNREDVRRGTVGKVFGPYKSVAEVKRQKDRLVGIILDENWLHFYVNACRLSGNDCVDVGD